MNPSTVTTGSAPITRTRGQRPVWLVSAGAALAAAAATELHGLVARAAGVPMSAGNIGAHTAEPIHPGMFAMATLICAFWGTVLAVLLARFAARPARTYAWTAAALTAVSLAGPLLAGDTATSTKLTLALGHLLAAAVIIPIVARRLSHSPSRR
jgi:uncharacterized membrane protein YjjP (DUF1212 family)